MGYLIIKRLLTSLKITAALTGFAVLTACAAADPDSGLSPQATSLKNLLEECQGCHGIDGISNDQNTPHIAGINEQYFHRIMEFIKDGKRFTHNSDMKAISERISSDDMQALANYFSSLPMKNIPQINMEEVLLSGSQQALVDSVNRGRFIHQNQCDTCHFNGGKAVGYGILAGQSMSYLHTVMQDYQNGNNDGEASDADVGNMISLIKNLTSQNVDDLVNYYGSLADEQVPTTPVNITAEQSADGSSVTLHWDDSTDDWDIKNYIIKREGSVIGTSKHSFFIDNSLPGAGANTATYEIQAVDVFNNESLSTRLVVDYTQGPNNGSIANPSTPNAATGEVLYKAQCMVCHNADPAQGKYNVDRGVKSQVILAKHDYILLADADSIALYIDEAVTAAAGGTATGTALNGSTLYANKCAGCHGTDPANGVFNIERGTTEQTITAFHKKDYSTEAESVAIAKYISDTINAGTGTGTGTGTGSTGTSITTPTSNGATITVARDVDIDEKGTMINSASELDIDGSNGTRGESRGAMGWDLSAVTTNQSIKSAKITLNITNVSSGQYVMYKGNKAWTESGIKWSEVTKAGPPLASFTPGSTGKQIVTFGSDGIVAVQSWIDGEANHGIYVISGGTSDGMGISSRESGNGALLEIEYGTPPPPGTAPPPPPAPPAAPEMTDREIQGKSLYKSNCSSCHGSDPNGGRRNIKSGTSASKIINYHGTRYSSNDESQLIAEYIKYALDNKTQ